MQKKTYNWKRFFIPFGEQPPLDGDGYLYDPEERWSKFYAENLVSLDQISDVPCLVLLGEPGIGKTVGIESEFKSAIAKAHGAGDKVSRFDLSIYSTDYSLSQTLFESRDLKEWQAGTHRLHLFLDSLDECRLSIPTVSSLLLDWLKKVPTDRLSLRIACRTADWPTLLKEGLPALWQNENAFAEYELCPLRKTDVKTAIEAHQKNSKRFCSLIEKLGVVAFATKPVTLQFLVNEFSQSDNLPFGQGDIYRKGCLALCREENASRRAARKTGKLSPNQRLLVATRIAALTIFSNRRVISIADDGKTRPDTVHIREIIGAHESEELERIEVTEEAVKETLACGLFRGTETFSWAHQTYAEFLAARFVVQNKMSVGQAMSLLTHSTDPERKIVPQLYQTAAWVATMEARVFDLIMQSEPELLLQSDNSTADVKTRERMVQSLFELYAKEDFRSLDYRSRRRLSQLNHPSLVNQLRLVLRDTTKNDSVRELAIDFTSAVKLKPLQNDLLFVALDKTAPYKLRCFAARAIAEIGDSRCKQKLKPLIRSKRGDTSTEDLKAAALKALWPGLISVKELLKNLCAPDERISSSYQTFLNRHLAEGLQAKDLPVLLKFLESRHVNVHISRPFEELNNTVVLMAWREIARPDVLSGFLQLALRRAADYEPLASNSTNKIILEEGSRDQKKRRTLLAQLFSVPTQKIIHLHRDSVFYPRFEDFFWLLQELEKAKKHQKRTIVHLIWDARNLDDPRCCDAIFVVAQKEKVLADRFAYFLNTLELASEENEKRLAKISKEKEFDARFPPKLPLDPPPKERVLTALTEFEKGKKEAWVNICGNLEANPDGYKEQPIADLTELPGWKEAEQSVQKRILSAAENYLRKQKPVHQKRAYDNRAYLGDIEAYRALRLLLTCNSSALNELGKNVWKKWARAIVQDWSNDDDGEFYSDLLRRAYENAPAETTHWLLAKIDQQNKGQGAFLHVIPRVEAFLTYNLRTALFAKLQDKRLKPNPFAQILTLLIRNNDPRAIAFAEQLLPSEPLFRWRNSWKALKAAIALCQEASDSGWNKVWPAMHRNQKFGRSLVTTIAANHEREAKEKISKNLKEEQIADLYLWVSKSFSRPKPRKGNLGQPREIGASIEIWRGSLIGQLRERGTLEACFAIQKISRKRPHEHGLAWTLFTARLNARRKTWEPTTPSDILNLAKNRNSKLVNNADQLLELVKDSLCRFQQKLQTDSRSEELYHRSGKEYRPIDEKEFARRVQRFLKDDLPKFGIFANCEPELRMGQRTDIKIEAVSQNKKVNDAFGTATVIVEVKGSWNKKELDSAMEEQLKKRYLVMNNHTHGIYLVGWFHHSTWNNSSKRHEKFPAYPIEQMRSRLQEQAERLSTGGIIIAPFVLDGKWVA